MALLTPSVMTQVWNKNPAATRWYLGTRDAQVDPGGLIRFGAVNDNIGCNLIVYDTDTGEPTTFAEHLMVNVASATPLAIYTFPAENAFVLFAASLPGTAANRKVYGQRIEYDLGAGTLTPGSLATWQSFNNGTDDLSDFVADVPDSDTINVLGWGLTGVGMSTLDLSAGSASTRANHTIDSIVGGGRDRIGLGAAAVHADGVVLLSCYVNSSGIGTSQTFIVPFAASPGSGTSTGLGRLTQVAARVPVGATDSYMVLGFNAGADTRYLLSASALTAMPSVEVLTDATVFNSTVRATYDDDVIVTYNREGASAGPTNKLRARQFVPSTGVEVAAWEYPGSYVDYVLPGMLSADKRFFHEARSASSFRVYEDPNWVPEPVGGSRWGSVGWAA